MVGVFSMSRRPVLKNLNGKFGKAAVSTAADPGLAKLRRRREARKRKDGQQELQQGAEGVSSSKIRYLHKIAAAQVLGDAITVMGAHSAHCEAETGQG